VALSLGGLRRRIEIALLPDDVIITLNLDRAARRERDRRRAQAQLARPLAAARAVVGRGHPLRIRDRTKCNDVAAAEAWVTTALLHGYVVGYSWSLKTWFAGRQLDDGQAH
jgi:hypothetical protein